MKFKKIYFIGIAFLWLTFSVKAQQRPQFSQYMINNHLFNPAASGVNDYLDFRLGFRNQWSGFDGAPRTVFLSGQLPFDKLFGEGGLGKTAKGPLPTVGTIDYGKLPGLKKRETIEEGTEEDDLENKEDVTKSKSPIKHALGGFLIYDEAGSITRWMFYGSYALHIPIMKQVYLSLGANLGLLNHSLNGGDLILDPFNSGAFDPALGNGNLNSLEPDMSLGVMAYKMGDGMKAPGYYLGFSVNQLLQSRLSFSDIEKNKLPLHYFISAGYSHPFGDKIDLIPSAIIKFVEGAPISFQLNARAAFQLGERNNIWFGGGYSNEGHLPILAGVGISKFLDLNFSYDWVFTDLNKYTESILPPGTVNTYTYEISLGLRLMDRRTVIRHNLF